MKHLGDITKINGAEIPAVDVITGGSPCQDLSVAGKRAGLAGERSGLFMEQIRIVKEMREKDVRSGRNFAHARPRYMVWENVPGAFSSGKPKGADFAAVLEEIIKAAEPGADVCVCVPDGGWTKSGCYYAEDGTWSVAWRVHDAQFWGVPQRRKRIALVADFGGLSAPEVLFERKGLSRDSEPGGTPGQETAGAAGDGVEGASGTISFQECAGKPGGGKGILIQHEHVGALSTLNNQSVLSFDPSMSRYAGTVFKDVAKTLTPGTSPGHHDAICTKEPILLESNQNHATVQTDGISTSLPASMGMGGGYVSMVCGINGDIAGTLDSNYFKGCGERQGVEREVVCVGNGHANQSVSDKAAALNTIDRPAVYDARGNGDGKTVCTLTGDHQNRVTDYTALCIGNGQANQSVSDKTGALNCMHDQQAVLCFQNTGQGWWNESDVGATIRTPCGGDAVKANLVAAVDCRNGVENGEINGTLQAISSGGTSLNLQNVCRTGSVVRRLTPLECERLQGYPDGWTDIGDWVDSKGKKHKAADSPRYKALGNSIALPFWFWLLRRISAQYERPATLGSLFDGIGGFPLSWAEVNGSDSVLWASEIEEFPIAVTKKHFGDDEAGIEGDIQKYL